jgi:hypothetical protein
LVALDPKIIASLVGLSLEAGTDPGQFSGMFLGFITMVLKNIKDPVLVNDHSKLFSNFSYLWKNSQILNATKLEIYFFTSQFTMHTFSNFK